MNAEAPVSRGTRNLVVFIICTGSFLSPLTLASVNVAIPAMARELQADAVSISLLPTLFLLANVALLLPFARLADNFGRKRLYATGIAINACASLGAYFAGNIDTILVLRCIQGAGSAMSFGTSLAIITSVFPARERGLPLGLNTAAIYIGLTAAPALGGLVTDQFGWRAVFLLPLPLALLLLAVILGLLRQEWRHARYTAFDWVGATIFAAWAVTLVSAIRGLPACGNVLLLALAGTFFALFIWQQARNPEPLIRVQLFRENRLFAFSLGTSSLMYASAYPLAFTVSLYLQYVRGMSALQAGQVIMLQAFAMALVAPVAGRLSDRVEPRVISTLGCLSFSLGLGLLSQLDFTTPPLYIGLAQLFLGVGFGLFSSPNNNAVMSAVHAGDVGVASATVNLARVSGNLVGISLVNLLVHLLLGDTEIGPGQYGALLTTVRLTMTISMLGALGAALLSASRGRMPRPD